MTSRKKQNQANLELEESVLLSDDDMCSNCKEHFHRQQQSIPDNSSHDVYKERRSQSSPASPLFHKEIALLQNTLSSHLVCWVVCLCVLCLCVCLFVLRGGISVWRFNSFRLMSAAAPGEKQNNDTLFAHYRSDFKFPVRVLSFNIDGSNRTLFNIWKQRFNPNSQLDFQSALLHFVRGIHPDIIAFQEMQQ